MISVAIAAAAIMLGTPPDADHLLGIRIGMTFEEFSQAFPGADCTEPGPGWRGIRACTVLNPAPAVDRVSVRFRPAWGDRAFSLSAELDHELLHRDFSPGLTQRFGIPKREFSLGVSRYGKAVKVWEWSSRDLHMKYGQRLYARQWYATVVFAESPAHARWIERELEREDATVSRRAPRAWTRTTRY